jgi:hypothetical protein
MALFDFLIRQEFTGYKVIEADSKEHAEEIAWQMLMANEIDPLNEFDCSTDVVEIDLIPEAA